MIRAVLITKTGTYSPTTEGKKDDMDYWLTTQQLVISITNVIVMAIPAIQKAHIPK